jgi:O-antigen/teichoic acid export membrane protein
MAGKSGVVRNVLANWSGLAVNMAVAFFMSPFLVHSLGDTMYGIWVLLLSVTGYMGLLDAGLRVSVVKYVARYSAMSDVLNLSRVVSTVLLIYTGLGVLVVGLASAGMPLLPRLFSIPPDALPTAQVVLLITAFNLAIALLMSVFNGMLAGRQRYDRVNQIGVGVTIARSLVIVLMVSQGHGIIALGLAHTGSQLVGGLLLMRCALREMPGLTIRWSMADKQTLKTLYGYSFFVLLNNVAMFLLFSSAEIVIGVFIGAAAVTYYAIAGSLLHHLARLIGMMTQVLHPYASAQEAKGDVDGVRRTIILGTKACLLIALPASITFMMVGKTFIHYWMGPSYASVAGPLVILLAVGRLFWLSQSSTGNIMLGVGRHKLLTTLNLATGVAGIALGIVLIRSMGLVGLALGMAVPMVVTQGVVLPMMTIRVFNVPMREYWRTAYMQPLLAVAPYAVTLAALMSVFPPGGLLELGAIVVLALPSYLVSAYFICFTATERRRFLQGYSRWLPAPAAESQR